MKTKSNTCILILLSLFTTAHAEPAILQCRVSDQGEVEIYDIKTNLAMPVSNITHNDLLKNSAEKILPAALFACRGAISFASSFPNNKIRCSIHSLEYEIRALARGETWFSKTTEYTIARQLESFYGLPDLPDAERSAAKDEILSTCHGVASMHNQRNEIVNQKQ